MAGGGDMGLGDLAGGMGGGGGDGSGGGSFPGDGSSMSDPMAGGSSSDPSAGLNMNQSASGYDGGSQMGGGPGMGASNMMTPANVVGTQNDPATQAQFAQNQTGTMNDAGSGAPVSPGSGTQPQPPPTQSQSPQAAQSDQLQQVADLLLGKRGGSFGADQYGNTYTSQPGYQASPTSPLPPNQPQPAGAPAPRGGGQTQQNPPPTQQQAPPMPQPRPAEAGPSASSTEPDFASMGMPQHGASGSWDLPSVASQSGLDSSSAGNAGSTPAIPGRFGAGADASLSGLAGQAGQDTFASFPPAAQPGTTPAQEAGYGPRPAQGVILPTGTVGNAAPSQPMPATSVKTSPATVGTQPIPGSQPTGPEGSPGVNPAQPQQGDAPAANQQGASNAPQGSETKTAATETPAPQANQGATGTEPQGPARPGAPSGQNRQINPIQAIVDLLFKGPQAFLQDLQSMAGQANQGAQGGQGNQGQEWAPGYGPSTGKYTRDPQTDAAYGPRDAQGRTATNSPQSPSAPGGNNQGPTEAQQTEQRRKDTGQTGGTYIVNDKGQRVRVQTNPDGSTKVDAQGNPVPDLTGVQGASGAPVSRGSYPALQSRMAPGRSMGPVHQGLQDTLAAGSQSFEQQHPGYKVQANSGFRGGGNDPHGRHNAVDMQIIGPQGPIPNVGADSTGLYHDLARHMLGAQRALHPELNGQLAWGGYFNAQGGHGFADPKTGANRPDLMHFDLEGSRPWRTAMRDRYNALGATGNYGQGAPRAQGPQSSLTPPNQGTTSGQQWQGNTIQHNVANTLSGAGMSPNGVAGVMANINAESGWNLRSTGGAGERGLVQFSPTGAELRAYNSYLRQNQVSDSPQAQMQFLAQRLQSAYPNTWQRMNNAATPEEAATTFAREYERPATRYLNQRVSNFRRNGVPSVDQQLGTSGPRSENQTNTQTAMMAAPPGRRSIEQNAPGAWGAAPENAPYRPAVPEGGGGGDDSSDPGDSIQQIPSEDTVPMMIQRYRQQHRQVPV